MAAKAERDKNGTTYIVPADRNFRTAGGKSLPALPEVTVWWARRWKEKREETLMIRQETKGQMADVVELTLGQVYDLIDALNKSIEGQ